MKKFRDLKQLKNILTDEDFENNTIELQFKDTDTSFYYVINNIYAVYYKNKIIGLYDADDNFIMGDIDTSFTTAKIWDNIVDNNTFVYYFVRININNYLNTNGLIAGTEELLEKHREINKNEKEL